MGISSGWVVLLLLGILYGLSKLRLLPVELGFPGSAALLLAGHFVLRDVFDLYGGDRRTSAATDTGDAAPTVRPMVKGVVLAAVLLFIAGAWLYRADMDARAARELRERREALTVQSLTLEQLAAPSKPDKDVQTVSVTFNSAAGKTYTAMHNFAHPEGPYVLLFSPDKDEEDLRRVLGVLAQAYAGTAENDVSDRTDDIAVVIQVPAGFTQKGMAETIKTVFQQNFTDTEIGPLHYKSDM